ncbi:TetR family transcriptional regulator [Psychrobium sp. 1_MG-2023]|uniref:TetR family transcriptional regulator n=1 Tax=Psychrobium sp. 1_MG-2023 TaxID=3062624 RepID=UPI000C33341E|nr:TetR family transcriptional regulator [Psychrobium sp. 1_MG-2023]MDP2559698.1 TetR family transcriptional regulator [Psychrobium sp. 1_MG-2023]PKF59568.1 TetR family transcriptional regulator [Alteromonadales bacterium alter-6D02]
MVRKTKEQAAATRALLLDGAEEVFFSKGFSQTTLMDIANHVQLTRGAIYWHFKNKVELFQAMLERVCSPIDQLSLALTDENEPDPLGKYREFSVNLLKNLAHDKRQQRVFSIIQHKFEYNGTVEQIELRQLDNFLTIDDNIKRTLTNAIKRQQLPHDLDVEQAAITKHAYFCGLIDNWLYQPQRFDLAAMAESLVDNYFFMLKNSPHLRKKS